MIWEDLLQNVHSNIVQQQRRQKHPPHEWGDRGSWCGHSPLSCCPAFQEIVRLRRERISMMKLFNNSNGHSVYGIFLKFILVNCNAEAFTCRRTHESIRLSQSVHPWSYRGCTSDLPCRNGGEKFLSRNRRKHPTGSFHYGSAEPKSRPCRSDFEESASSNGLCATEHHSHRLAKFSRRISRLSRACFRRIRLAEIRTKDTILVRLSPLLTNPTEL